MIVARAGDGTSLQRLARFVERWLLKQRYVVEYPAEAEGHGHAVVDCSPADLSSALTGVELPERLTRLAGQRVDSADEFPLFVALDDHQTVLGYSFLFVPKQVSWHDCLPINAGEARSTSSWVEEEFRGQGVRGSLFAAQVARCSARGLRFTAVIERSNQSSIRSSAKSGAVVWQRNYLLKALGRNVLSVTTNPVRVYVLAGTRRSHR